MTTTAPPQPTIAHEKQVSAVRRQAQQLVAQTFYGTLLKQMRDSPFKDKLFSGGRGGEAWGEMLDGQLTKHMLNSSRNTLVESLVKRLTTPRIRLSDIHMDPKSSTPKAPDEATPTLPTLPTAPRPAVPSDAGRLGAWADLRA